MGPAAPAGHFSELLGRINAKAKMAPGLLHCIRSLLEQQKMQGEEISSYVTQLGDVRRYDSAFKKLFVLLTDKGLDPVTCCVNDAAQAIIKLHALSASDARNAYSALCLLPGFQGIRFSPLLYPFKKQWNVSNQKYATFWDPEPVLSFLKKRELKTLDLAQLRLQLIMLWRLLALHRGIYLARTVRTISQVGPDFFILWRRKGWKAEKWEQIIKIDSDKNISPWHVLKEYVERTASQVKAGDQLLWSLDQKKPLTSNRINSLTKDFLSKMGIPTSHWQAHSTRGAGVLFYKRKGFLAEEVCELGQWKNSQAFSAH